MKTINTLIFAALTAISAIATPIDTTEIRIVAQDQNQLRFSITGDGTDQIDEPGLRIIAYKTSVVVVWDPVGPHYVYDGFATKTGVMNYLVGFEGQDWSYSNGTWNFAYWAPFFTPSLDTDPPHQAVPESGSSALLLLIGVAVIGAGCTSTKIHRFADGAWTLERNSKLQKHTIPEATVSTNGTFTLKGYSNDGGSQALEGMLKAAAEGAAKGSK